MPKKILIVDDDPGICNSFAVILRNEGYRVDAISNSKEAAILIKRKKYDIYLFDYKMSGLNGIDLLKMTKKVNPQCSVYIVSGMLNIDELCNKELDSGLLDGVVNKPFDVEPFLQKISALV